MTAPKYREGGDSELRKITGIKSSPGGGSIGVREGRETQRYSFLHQLVWTGDAVWGMVVFLNHGSKRETQFEKRIVRKKQVGTARNRSYKAGQGQLQMNPGAWFLESG